MNNIPSNLSKAGVALLTGLALSFSANAAGSRMTLPGDAPPARGMTALSWGKLISGVPERPGILRRPDPLLRKGVLSMTARAVTAWG